MDLDSSINGSKPSKFFTKSDMQLSNSHNYLNRINTRKRTQMICKQSFTRDFRVFITKRG